MKRVLLIVLMLSIVVLAFSYDLYDSWNSSRQNNNNSLYGNNSNNFYGSNNNSLYGNKSNSLYNNNYQSKSYTKPYKDTWGNSYKYQSNLWKDTDKDGTINYFDYNDRNKKVQTKSQSNYYKLYNW